MPEPTVSTSWSRRIIITRRKKRSTELSRRRRRRRGEEEEATLLGGVRGEVRSKSSKRSSSYDAIALPDFDRRWVRVVSRTASWTWWSVRRAPLGQLSWGTVRPDALCQASSVTLTVDEPFPVVDGQPWEQSAS